MYALHTTGRAALRRQRAQSQLARLGEVHFAHLSLARGLPAFREFDSVRGRLAPHTPMA